MAQSRLKKAATNHPEGLLGVLMDAHEAAAKPRDCRRAKPAGPHVSEAQRTPRVPGAFGNEPDLPLTTNGKGQKVIDRRHPDMIAERKWSSLRKKV